MEWMRTDEASSQHSYTSLFAHCGSNLFLFSYTFQTKKIAAGEPTGGRRVRLLFRVSDGWGMLLCGEGNWRECDPLFRLAPRRSSRGVFPSLGWVVLASGACACAGVAPEGEPAVSGSAAFLAAFFFVIVIDRLYYSCCLPLCAHARIRLHPSTWVNTFHRHSSGVFFDKVMLCASSSATETIGQHPERTTLMDSYPSPFPFHEAQPFTFHERELHTWVPYVSYVHGVSNIALGNWWPSPIAQ